MLDILSEASMLGCRAIDVPMEVNVKLLPNQRENLDDPDKYRRLVRKTELPNGN